MKARLARLLACTLPHLAVWAMMLLVLAPQIETVWQCQGQACGQTRWTCCCSSRTPQCDQSCGSPFIESGPDSSKRTPVVSSAPAKCHCSMSVQDASVKSLRSNSASFAAPLHVVFVLAPTVRFDVPREVARIRPLEARGPPLRTACLTHPSLRAPPVA